MELRSEIRRILAEELASLENPLDKMKDVAIDTQDVQDKVNALKARAKKERDDIMTTMNAKRKAKMVPQGNDPEIERQRRTLVDKEINDLDAKRVAKDEEQDEIDMMATDLTQLSTSVSDLQKQKTELQAMLAQMSGNSPEVGGM
jgi:chromosome segregation ATPase